ncbi:MAG: hypothetical protein IT423_24440 [Pirellulaceae bacterium]|nr:hypothetical protein [Pirellulaceae bacterium]
MSGEGASDTLERFFTGLSEYVFHSQLGVVDTQLVDYVSDLLVRFSRVDTMHRVRQLDGRRATDVVCMIAEAEQRLGEAKREVHRHIGDYTLFWTGVYPESLRELQASDKSDQFISYCAQGKRAYRIASDIAADGRHVSSDLLSRLSVHFEMCAYGLREIRREWERRDTDGSSDVPFLLM